MLIKNLIIKLNKQVKPNHKWNKLSNKANFPKTLILILKMKMMTFKKQFKLV